MPWLVLGLEGPRAGMRTWARVALAAMAVDRDDPEGSAHDPPRCGARCGGGHGRRACRRRPRYTLAKTGTTMA